MVIPNDLQEHAYPQPPRLHRAVLSGLGDEVPSMVPHATDLQRAADVLKAGRRVAILVGAGAMRAGEQVLEAAEILQAGVAKALLAKAVVPEDIHFVTGAIGLLGTRPSYNMMLGCDTLLMMGSTYPCSEFVPREGAARGVQIDVNPRKLSIRYPMKVNLMGDAAEMLKPLIPYLTPKAKRGRRYTDPSIPPLAPHISFKQAVAYSAAQRKGDPNRVETLRHSAAEFIDSLLPHRE